MPTAESRPSDQSPLRVTAWPRASQSRDHGFAEAVLDHGARDLVGARPEGVDQRRGVQHGRIDRLLGGVPADEHAQKRRQLPLVLLIAAGRAERHDRSSVAQHEGGAQGRARPRPGRRAEGEASSSQVICRRVPRQNPSSGMVGEDCSHPPDGVAEIMLPQRSTTSMWHVSPRVSPVFATVGSPVPGPRRGIRRSCAGAGRTARAPAPCPAATRATPRRR